MFDPNSTNAGSGAQLTTTNGSKPAGSSRRGRRPQTAEASGSTQSRRRRGTVRGSNRVTASSPTLTFTKDDRPYIDELNLPGPRRASQGRGGAHSKLDVLRYVIRCPLLSAMAEVLVPRKFGKRPAYKDLFWLFVHVATREFASGEALIQELETHWSEIAKEFYFEHGIALPVEPSFNYASYNTWRTNVVIDRYQQLELLVDRFTEVSVPLALAVRHSEVGGETRDLLTPGVWDIIAADGTVRDAPSNARAQTVREHGELVVDYTGTRAKKGLPRVHEAVGIVDKPAGAQRGLYNLVATTKGADTYTRTVLGVELGRAGEGEAPIAKRLLDRVYDRVGDAFSTLVYDGTMTPKYYQDLTAAYGVFCVNANYARSPRSNGRGESRHRGFEPDSSIVGEGQYRHGRRRGRAKLTHATDLPQVECLNGGQRHVHYLAADDGAVYETNLALVNVNDVDFHRVAPLLPSHVERKRDSKGRYYFQLTVEGDCSRGGTYQATYALHWTQPAKNGHVSWRSLIANIRLIPEIAEHYPVANGHRNQIESYFSWMEKCFYRQDKAASWGYDEQLFDLLAAALLHNAEAWAHLAYRHEAHAEQLADELASLAVPDLTGVVKKPPALLKKVRTNALHAPIDYAVGALELNVTVLNDLEENVA